MSIQEIKKGLAQPISAVKPLELFIKLACCEKKINFIGRIVKTESNLILLNVPRKRKTAFSKVN